MNAVRSGQSNADQTLNKLLGIAAVRRVYQSSTRGMEYLQDDIEDLFGESGSSEVKGETPGESSRSDETSCLLGALLRDETPQRNNKAGVTPGHLGENGETPAFPSSRGVCEANHYLQPTPFGQRDNAMDRDQNIDNAIAADGELYEDAQDG